MHSYPAAFASWIALHPTLDDAPQTRTVCPCRYPDVCGYRSPRWSFSNRPQAAVPRPSGRTAASVKDSSGGIGLAMFSNTTVNSWKAPCAAWFVVAPTDLTQHSVANPEPSHASADRRDLAGDVTAQDRWIVEPGENRAVLQDPVDGIDRDRAVADQDLAWAGLRHADRPDLQSASRCRLPCS